MKDFPNGVSFYTKATVEIGFPENDLCCYWCPLMQSQYGTRREVCGKTGEILLSPKHSIGYDCPLKFENKEK